MSSEEVIAAASVVNLLIIAVPAFVTHRYANETRRIAEASSNQATSTAHMADEARKEAEASSRIAENALRPVLIQWIDSRQISSVADWMAFIVHYENIGSGPALNIEWSLQQPGAEWVDHPVALGWAWERQVRYGQR